MSSRIWADVDIRMHELADEHHARMGVCGVFVETESLRAQAGQYGVWAYLIPEKLTRPAAWHEMSQAAAIRVASTEVLFNPRCVAKKNQRSSRHPFGAMGAAAGPRGEDATVPAFVFGVVLGLDVSVGEYAYT